MTHVEYKVVKPEPSLSDFVESFWMLVNQSDEEKDVVVLPDGRFDVFFSYSAKEPFHVTLSGLANEPSQNSLPPKSVMFNVSFKLLAGEYLPDLNISSMLNQTDYLPPDFLGITSHDLNDFDAFCTNVSEKLKHLLKRDIDDRKQKMFDLIYASNGAATVKEISESAGWSSRQINRYFNQWFGMSLKTYCTILRYRASFTQIKEGKLFPEEHFTDQAHFIKSIKKYSGVTPKELTKNKDDRFIQLSTLPKK